MYMSPEQAKGEHIDHRSDLFSLGSVLYTLLTGRPAFRAETTVAVLRRVCKDDPRPIREVNGDVPKWVCAVVEKLMAKDPADRIQTAAEVADLLARYLAHLEDPDRIPPPPAVRGVRVGQRRGFRRAAVVLAALVAVSALGVVAYRAFQPTDEHPVAQTPVPEPTPTPTPIEKPPAVWKPPTAEELAARTSAMDGHTREQLPTSMVALLGGPTRVPPEVVAVLGDGRFRLTRLPPEGTHAEMRQDREGKYLAVPNGNSVAVFDARTGERFRTLSARADQIVSVSFSPDGRHLAGLNLTDPKTPYAIRIWELASGKEQTAIQGAAGRAWAIQYAPDGKQLFCLGSKGLDVWDLPTEKIARSFPAAPGVVPNLVHAFGLSADGKKLAWGGDSPKVHVWTVGSDDPPRLLDGHTRSIMYAAFSPDGKVLATGNYTELILWDAEKLEPLKKIDTAATWLAFDSDGKSVLTATCVTAHGPNAGGHLVTRWDLSTFRGKPLPQLRPWPGHVQLSGDGKTVFFLVGDGTERDRRVQHHDSATGLPQPPLCGPGEVLSVAVSPDGRLIAAGEADGTVRLWDLGGWKAGEPPPPSRALTGHTAPVHSVAFSPDGKLVASRSHDGTIRLWNPTTGETVRTIQGEPRSPAPSDALEFDGRSNYVTVPNWTFQGKHPLTVEAWVTFKRPLTTPHQEHVLGDAEQSGLAIVSKNRFANATALEWSMFFDNNRTAGTQVAPRNRPVHVAGVYDPKGEISLYVDGKLAQRTSIGTDTFRPSTAPFTLGANPVPLALSKFFLGTLHHVRVSRRIRYDKDFTPASRFEPDADTLILYRFEDGQGDKLTDASGNNHHGKIVGARWVKTAKTDPKPGASDVAFSADSKTLAAGEADGGVRLWDVATGEAQSPLRWHTQPVNSVACSSDGRFLASAGLHDRKVHITDLKTLRRVQTLGPSGDGKADMRVAFAGDGHTLAYGGWDDKVRLRDLTDQKETVLSGSVPNLDGLAVDPTGRFVAASGGGAVRVWDRTAPEHPVVIRPGPFGATARHVAFTPEGRYIVVAGANGTVSILRTPAPGILGSPEAPRLASAEAVRTLRLALEAGPPSLASLADADFAKVPLTKTDAATARALLWNAHVVAVRKDRADELKAGVIKDGTLAMPFTYKTFGQKPKDGWSLYVSLHGSGGVPKADNDQQWEQQKSRYTLDEGIYLTPRAPTDTHNQWYEGHIDRMLPRLIEDLIAIEGVNPNRVYLLGVGSGADGVYQIAPRLADHWAGASVLAGHPNKAPLLPLRNVPFAIQIGEKDIAYDRARTAAETAQALDALRQGDPKGYEHFVKVHEGKEHWTEFEDKMSLPWLARFTRNPVPERIVWKHSGAVPKEGDFYWLAVPPGQAKPDALVAATRNGQTIEITAAEDVGKLRIRFDDRVADLDKPVTVRRGDKVLFTGELRRTAGEMIRTLAGRGDPELVFDAEVEVDLSVKSAPALTAPLPLAPPPHAPALTAPLPLAPAPLPLAPPPREK
jgi:WD40 repeat protein/poly(3-hydroxybutyrate) depolymerase